MKVALSVKLEELLIAKAEALGLSPQDALRMLAAAWVGGESHLVPSVAPQGSQSVPSAAPSSPSPSPSLHSPTPPSLPPPEHQKNCADQGGELVLFPEIPVVDAAKDLARKKREAEKEAELAWRVGEVWSAFLYARQCFFREHNGVRPTVEPALDPVRQYIRASLQRHDKHLLAAEDRDRWRRESSTRGAGIGIFHDPWCTGTTQGNDARAGGKRYLEPWRPWRQLHGKPDPVPRFAELYFEIRDVSEAAR